jgi:glycerol-3-phosphate dehydrogenase (NAD(P)+)
MHALTTKFAGPSFAKEILTDMPTAVTIASENLDVAERVKQLFASPTFRVYITDDVIGVEVGGALKNVFAIAAGCVAGMGFGMNTKAMLVTRGCAEMTNIALAMGARAETLAGLSGIGDLMLTCFGSASRNQSVGLRLGQGKTISFTLLNSARRKDTGHLGFDVGSSRRCCYNSCRFEIS